MTKKKTTAGPITRRARATRHKIEQRVQAIMQFMRDGGDGFQSGPEGIRQFVAAKEEAGEEPWKLERGRTPLSARTIERYAALATRRRSDEIRKEENAMIRLDCAKKAEKNRRDFAEMKARWAIGMPR